MDRNTLGSAVAASASAFWSFLRAVFLADTTDKPLDDRPGRLVWSGTGAAGPGRPSS